ncbi:hypothetical protein FNL56_09370 [Tardiphaga sp. vice304]|uniref:hypothetical protein n=1 Tax=unclassified Tardiphaga TaxID=2631404 RepID=UPI0011626E4E|nr:MULTISPECIES: hypothetical protein [unclassified Tardiphaga]QDM16066.1 hypothetical protein FNL53_09215 [Tardiphaga sp. vice278]QDM26274.1 hypothetical protein FNL56_09370 [Tardiphaga sp. vice304]
MKKPTRNTGSVKREESSEWGMDSRWEGTAIIYAASGETTFGFSGEYDLSFRDETRPNELRGHREDRRRRGLKVKDLSGDKLRNEMLVVFGADMSANEAIVTLKTLLKRLMAEGLYVGRDNDGDFVKEAVSD